MKKVLLLSMIIVWCCSCSSSLYLTGEYNTQHYSTETSRTVGEVWNNIVDWFFETQTPISLIDKDSGIITSGKISLRGSHTYEMEGKPDNVSKFIVLPSGASFYSDARISGRVMARVKSDNGKTKISVFLGDIECTVGQSYIEAKSTGVFEQNWLKYISRK